MNILTLINKYTYKHPFLDCFEWKGRRNEKGYGIIIIDKKKYKAHRLAYELAKGNFNKNLHVLHRCDNPGCVNPEHLFLGTNWDNILDCHKKGRGTHNMKWIVDRNGNKYFGQRECSDKTGLTRKQIEKRLLGLVKNDLWGLKYLIPDHGYNAF